jgi:hypothetical protein
MEIFPKLYASRSERCVVCYRKFLNLKEIFCLRKKYTHDCQPWEKNCLKCIHYFIISNVYTHQLIVLSKKNNYSSQDSLYSFYMKYSVIENRWEKYYTRLKTFRLLQYDEMRIEQRFAAHIVHSCQQYWTILLHPIQAKQYCSILLTSVNNVGSKTLFSPVEQRARRFFPCIAKGSLSKKSKQRLPWSNKLNQHERITFQFKSTNRDNQEQKLSRQPHKCPPHHQFNVVWMSEKRKFNPLFPTLIMGAGGRPTYFKIAKNVKSLIIFARDCRPGRSAFTPLSSPKVGPGQA